MKWRIPFAFLLLCLFLGAGCGKPPETSMVSEPPLPLNKFDDLKIQKIYDLADRRLGDSLLPYLEDANPRYRLEAAKVMGSVQDSGAGPILQKLSDASGSELVDAAAWALGQLGDSNYVGQFADRFGDVQHHDFESTGEALGKAGSKSQIDRALSYGRGDADLGIMLMLYRAGLRKIVPDSGLSIALEQLANGAPKTQLYAACYLGRVAELGPLPDPSKVLKCLQSDGDDEIQAQVVKSLRRCDKPECTDELRRIILDEKEGAATRVGAIRAAGAVHPVAEEVRKAVVGANEQVAVTAAEHIRDNVKQDFGASLALARQVKAWRPRAILVHAAMKDAVGQNDGKGKAMIVGYIDSLSDGAGPYEKGALLVALGWDASQHDRLLATALTLEKVVSTYAMEALTTYHDEFVSRDNRVWIGQLQQLVRTGDPGMVAMAAEHIASPSPNAGMVRGGIKDVGFLDSALVKLRLPADIEAYNAVEKAIAAIQKKEVKLTKLEHETGIDWALVKRIPTAQTAEIKTNRGTIVFTLKVEDAPGTVANFVKLVQQGFYDGKTFHRVVPAFVAQGGCPRGDGWGSTPETIRSEWPRLHYGRGQVGMASAGKDTESCQWFITHCEVPHLDGRYTIFATVTSGMDVVDVLEIGDVIEKITLPGLE